MLRYGTKVVAGVSPGHEGETIDGIPIFDFVQDAVNVTSANTTLVSVPGLPNGIAAILEAAFSGIRLALWLADPVPIHDMIRLKSALAGGTMRLVGPNSPGVISPGKTKVGFMPSQCYRAGRVGVVSKSGSLSYEVCLRLTQANIGQSTVVGIGGDPIKGTGLVEMVQQFDDDPETEAILVLTEVGGTEEYALAQAVASGAITTPVAALLVGATAPAGKKLGHAGALILSERERFKPKVDVLEEAGVIVAGSLTGVADAVHSLLTIAPPSATG